MTSTVCISDNGMQYLSYNFVPIDIMTRYKIACSYLMRRRAMCNTYKPYKIPKHFHFKRSSSCKFFSTWSWTCRIKDKMRDRNSNKKTMIIQNRNLLRKQNQLVISSKILAK